MPSHHPFYNRGGILSKKAENKPGLNRAQHKSFHSSSQNLNFEAPLFPTLPSISPPQHCPLFHLPNTALLSPPEPKIQPSSANQTPVKSDSNANHKIRHFGCTFVIALSAVLDLPLQSFTTI